jgi:hypothetical protein
MHTLCKASALQCKIKVWRPCGHEDVTQVASSLASSSCSRCQTLCDIGKHYTSTAQDGEDILLAFMCGVGAVGLWSESSVSVHPTLVRSAQEQRQNQNGYHEMSIGRMQVGPIHCTKGSHTHGKLSTLPQVQDAFKSGMTPTFQAFSAPFLTATKLPTSNAPNRLGPSPRPPILG